MSNVTTLVCDIVPLWSGYVWGAQGGVTWDVCSLFLVTVPPFFALYFGLLHLQSTLQSNKNILAKRVSSFNRRVERIILELRSLELRNKVNDWTEELAAIFSKVPIPHISFQSAEQSSRAEAAKL